MNYFKKCSLLKHSNYSGFLLIELLVAILLLAGSISGIIRFLANESMVRAEAYNRIDMLNRTTSLIEEVRAGRRGNSGKLSDKGVAISWSPIMYDSFVGKERLTWIKIDTVQHKSNDKRHSYSFVIGMRAIVGAP